MEYIAAVMWIYLHFSDCGANNNENNNENNDAPVRDAEEVGEGNLNVDDITLEEEPGKAPEPVQKN